MNAKKEGAINALPIPVKNITAYIGSIPYL